MNPAWSWLLTAFGVAGLLLAGRGVWWGWAVNLCAQAAWLTYGLVSAQPGFVVSALLYAAVYAHNARRAHRARAHSEHARARAARTGRAMRAQEGKR